MSACSQCTAGSASLQKVSGGGLACGKACNLPGCLTCSDSVTCAKCAEGFHAVNAGAKCKLPDCTWTLNRTSTPPLPDGGFRASGAGCRAGFTDVGLAFDLPFIRATGCPEPTNLARDPSGLWLAYGGACSQVVPPLPSGYRITPPWNASVTITSLLITNWSPNATLPFIVRFTTPTGATLDVVVPRGSAKGKAWSLPAQGLTIPAASPDTPPLTPGYTVELLAFPRDTPSRTAWAAM
ncbi:hypothetical protein CHLNCDRAFT_140942 [Chlorella variabilis]|uniref:Uncharacterized protein n=1 Tax=Chlorella variabilis TaxID=554065 RepID=E1Z6K3_CHLVA|nr:hypothetical protein CHLNCDRAFT_140942 [Chlorella variabilis]EFN58947.1 hypothetical protein CHLNCDRAFT_140942 [Chlorella variabilis]|eukprot:XP_005851049.1 hypothetical protein CHLNCDRAFT_140942 [Chlorella variabilis]